MPAAVHRVVRKSAGPIPPLTRAVDANVNVVQGKGVGPEGAVLFAEGLADDADLTRVPAHARAQGAVVAVQAVALAVAVQLDLQSLQAQQNHGAGPGYPRKPQPIISVGVEHL